MICQYTTLLHVDTLNTWKTWFPRLFQKWWRVNWRHMWRCGVTRPFSYLIPFFKGKKHCVLQLQLSFGQCVLVIFFDEVSITWYAYFPRCSNICTTRLFIYLFLQEKGMLYYITVLKLMILPNNNIPSSTSMELV